MGALVVSGEYFAVQAVHRDLCPIGIDCNGSTIKQVGLGSHVADLRNSTGDMIADICDAVNAIADSATEPPDRRSLAEECRDALGLLWAVL